MHFHELWSYAPYDVSVVFCCTASTLLTQLINAL